MTALSRRRLIAAGTAGAAALACGHAPTARASARSPGEPGHHVPFYRSRLGSAEITVVSDGTISWAPGDLWSEVSEEKLEGFLADHLQPTDSMRLQLNAMVVDLGGRRVLIDAGCGAKWEATGGGLSQNLMAAGIDPATIDTVIFTHLHPDHLWGVTDGDGALVFPEADYFVAEPELAYWNDPDLPGRMPDEWLRRLAETTLAHLARIEDRLRPIGASAEVVPGIGCIPTHGHTPGHVSILLESDGATLLSTGDLVGDPLIGFERPDWNIGIDWDPEAGTASRLAFLDRAAADRERVFGFHLPWPGFGQVARDGEAYRWIQEEWIW